jgi:hypothetical protein
MHIYILNVNIYKYINVNTYIYINLLRTKTKGHKGGHEQKFIGLDRSLY